MKAVAPGIEKTPMGGITPKEAMDNAYGLVRLVLSPHGDSPLPNFTDEQWDALSDEQKLYAGLRAGWIAAQLLKQSLRALNSEVVDVVAEVLGALRRLPYTVSDVVQVSTLHSSSVMLTGLPPEKRETLKLHSTMRLNDGIRGVVNMGGES